MKKLLAIVLTLCMMMAYLPTGVMASDATGGGKLHHFIGEEQVLIENTFNNVAQENIPTESSKAFVTASSEGYDKTTWTINNNMYMFQDVGEDGSSAIRFIASDAASYPGAHISLNEQFFGVNKIGEPESPASYQGLAEGVIVTEFDIKTDALCTLSLLGTGTTHFSSTASSNSYAYLFRANGYLGNSNTLTYNVGEWAKVMVYVNLSGKYMGYYYNGKLVHTTPIDHNFGVKEIWGKYGLMFQAFEGMVNFAVDNFKITYSNATHLGFANFNGYELPSSGSLDGAFVPRNYSPANDLGTVGKVTLVAGKNGDGDDAIHLAPNGAANPNYKFYYQNKPYKGAQTGLLHAKFDVKFDEYFDMGLSGGFGVYFSTPVFTKAGTIGKKEYSLNAWHNMEVVSDWDNNSFKVYMDGELCIEGTLPYGFVKDEYLQFLIWGRSDVETGKGVAFDNISFTYYDLPRVKSVSSKQGSDFVESFTDGANVLKLNLTKDYTNISVSDVVVEVNSEKVSASVSQDSNAVVLTLGNPVSKGDTVDVTILSSAIVGTSTLAPQGYEYTVSETVKEAPSTGTDVPDVPDVPVEPDEPEVPALPTVDADPGAPMKVDSLTLYPADGTFAYEDDALILKAFAPEASENVKFTFDSEEITDVKNVENMYYVALDSNRVSNGNHTFTAEITLNGESVSKTSNFYYYNSQKTLLFNDYEEITSVNSGSNTNVRPKSSYGYDVTTYSVNNSMTLQLGEGAGGKGTSVGFKSGEAAGVYPGAHISLDEQFFGVENVGKPETAASYAGLSEGVVITEFDAKVNKKVGIGFLGTGPSSYSNLGDSKAGTKLFNLNGTVGHNSPVTYTLGEWGKVKIISNLDAKSMSLYYNDILVHTEAVEYPYGNKELWGRYGLMFQAYSGEVDILIDNFKISHSMATRIGNTTFNSLTPGGEATRYDGHFSPRNYSFSADHASGAVTAVAGKDGTGDVAVHMAVNGKANPNFKFFFQNKPYKNATKGALSASFDIKLDSFMDVGFSGGFGLHFSSPVFTTSGKIGNLSYEKDKWYNIKYYADWDRNRAYIYVNDVLATGFNNIPYPMLNAEYFQILVWNNDNLQTGEGITVDNFDFTYYALPEIKVPSSKVGDAVINGKISRKATSVTFPLTSEFKSLAKEDITVKLDSEIVDADAITFADNAITVNFAEAIGVDRKFEILIGKDEVVGTLSSVGRDYRAEFVSEGYPEEGYSINTVSTGNGKFDVKMNFYFIENDDNFYIAIASYKGNKLDKVDASYVCPRSDIEEGYTLTIEGIDAAADRVVAYIWSEDMKPLEIKDLLSE
ncbi:MAG: hypothetical protein IKV88_09660 [Clostridia bacterium]|nr:hypothetical protein [Clostridia bacterium]